MEYVIGTRGSKLALAQACYVQKRLKEVYPSHTFPIRVIRTVGDRTLDKPISELGDKGVFVREIETELLERRADIGVHSMKDMPSCPAAGLMFAKAWEREDPRDVLVLREKGDLRELKAGAVIGTGSMRRSIQLKKLRPDLTVVNIRGNVDTRLKIMQEKKLDGIVLAAAGLNRLGLSGRVTQYLDAEQFLPAPAQGVLALELRAGEEGLLRMLNALCDEKAACATEAERGFLQEIGGGCHTPVGAFCRKEESGDYVLSVMYGNASGDRQAYAAVYGEDPKALAKEAAARIRRQMAGTVSLVGAGPGDPGLITVKGLAAVQSADCILYDRLSSPELLDEAKPGCELIYVGKENKNHTKTQGEIHRLLVQKSMEYERTVRLKGGDVYVFGRGGEEGLYLREHGVPFEVIPGLTSAIAGPAFAGIPVTHRGMATGFHVVAAHSKEDTLAHLNFHAMADGRETCVFLMGLSKVGELAKRLMEAGMPHTAKIAVISCATTQRQRVCVSDLAHIAKEAARAKLVSPALIVTGEVVSLQKELNFACQKPLSQKKYLVPKIGSGPSGLRELLHRQGAGVKEIQLGEICYLGQKIDAEALKAVDWLVFTSKNGVDAFFWCMAKNRLDVRALSHCKIAVIGEQTAKKLEEHGMFADLMPAQTHSGALAEELKKQVRGQEKIWYLKARNADSQLKEALQETCQAQELLVYENRAVLPDFNQVGEIAEYDGILFTCASLAERFYHAAGDSWEKCEKIYSIGKKTTKRLQECGAQDVTEAKEASYEGMLQMLTREI